MKRQARSPFSVSAINVIGITGTIGILLVILTGLVGATPIVNAETHRGVTDASLVTPMGYLVLAPFCTILDALTLLSVHQHIALFVTVALCVSTWRIVTHRRGQTTWTREVRVGVLAFGTLLGVYAIGVLVPRPMAAIRLPDPEDIAIDFHSHTTASWDARHSFTVERNRRWHTLAGFHVAYVSDHKSLAGALRGMATNPLLATDTGPTVLLPAIELRDQYEHIIALGIDTAALVDAKGNWHDPMGDTLAMHRAHAPLLILTIPGNITRLPANETAGVARTMAIELSDGSPKGLGQIQRDERAIVSLADQRHWAVVAGSDNHGWGNTAVAWSIMHVPGWRTLHPAQLDSAVQQQLRQNARAAVRVYLRDTPNPGRSLVALACTAPALLWCVLVDLNWPERCGWIAWILVVALLSLAYNTVWPRTSTTTRTTMDTATTTDTIMRGTPTA